MYNADREFKCTLENDFGRRVTICSADYEPIEVIEERLAANFPKGTNCTADIFYIYCMHVENYQALNAKQLSVSDNWLADRHMEGIFYRNETANGSFVVWNTRNHHRFGDASYFPQEVMLDLMHGDPNTCGLIISERNMIYLYNEINKYTKLYPMRIARSLFMYSMWSNGYRYYHAAAIKYKGKGVLFLGASGKGKTSLLLSMMDNSDCELISNDKVYIGCNNNSEILVYGWPTVVNIGIGNLGQYGQLKRYLTNIDDITCNQDLYGYTASKTNVERSKKIDESGNKFGNKLTTTHHHLARLFDVKLIKSSKIDLAVISNLGWGFDCENVRRLSEEEKKQVIVSNKIHNISDQLGWAGYEKVDDTEVNNMSYTMLSTIPFYEYHADFKNVQIKEAIDSIIQII